jgi:hypothetical protein
MRDFGDRGPLKNVLGEFGEYKLWAGNVGAAHSGHYYQISLDYRLREASFYKTQVRWQLSQYFPMALPVLGLSQYRDRFDVNTALYFAFRYVADFAPFSKVLELLRTLDSTVSK